MSHAWEPSRQRKWRHSDVTSFQYRPTLLLVITHDRMKRLQNKRHPCVRLVSALPTIPIMTPSVTPGSASDLDLRSNFKLTFQGVKKYVIRRLSTRGTRWCNANVCISFRSKVMSHESFGQKLCFCDVISHVTSQNLKKGYQSLRLVTPDTLVFVPGR